MYRKKDYPGMQKSPAFCIMKKLSGAAVKYYCHIWAALFGLGLFFGTRVREDNISIPGHVQYMVIALMFLILGGSLFVHIKSNRNNDAKSRGRELLLLVVIPAIIFLICGYLIKTSGEKPSYIIENTPASISGDIHMRGRVSSHPEMIYGSIYMDMVLESSGHEALKGGDTISVIIKRPEYKEIFRDDILDIVGEIKVRKDKLVLEAWSVENIPFADHDLKSITFRLRQSFFRCISGAFSHYLRSEDSALAHALILGDRRYLSDSQYGLFRQSGTAHLIAISGMHISFLAAIIFLMLEKIFRRPILLLLLTAILLSYNFILGPAASVMRATIWILGSTAAASWKRKSRPSYMLCLSFIFILVLQPGMVEQAGFWLSFSAMAGIVFIRPVIRMSFKAINIPSVFLDNHMISTLLMTFCIQLSCGPLVLYYFGTLPLISPISNLVILPFFYTLILLLFIASAVCIIWPPAGGALLYLAPFIIKPLCAIAGFFSHPRFLSVDMESIQQGKLFIYYFTILAVLSIIKILTAKRFDF